MNKKFHRNDDYVPFNLISVVFGVSLFNPLSNMSQKNPLQDKLLSRVSCREKRDSILTIELENSICKKCIHNLI